MRNFYLCLLTILIFASLTLAGTAAWNYDPAFQPISKEEVAKIIRDPKTTASAHELVRGRAGTSHILEYAVSLYDQERKKRPADPLIQSAFCYAVFVSQMGGYTPSDTELFKQQQNTLWYPASYLADEVTRKAGAKIPFCWRTAAYQNIMGIGRGWQKGMERAEKALSLDPNDSYTLRLLAFAHTRHPMGNPDKAIAYAHQIVKLAPKSSKGYAYLYSAYVDKKNYIEAFEYLQLSQNKIPPQNRSKSAYTTYKILAERQAAGKAQ